MKKFNEFEQSILNGLNEAVEFSKGKKTDCQSFEVNVKDIDVKELRESLNLTQQDFANTFGVSVSTIRNWEQRLRQPEGPAKILLNVISYNPKCVFDAIRVH